MHWTKLFSTDPGEARQIVKESSSSATEGRGKEWRGSAGRCKRNGPDVRASTRTCHIMERHNSTNQCSRRFISGCIMHSQGAF